MVRVKMKHGYNWYKNSLLGPTKLETTTPCSHHSLQNQEPVLCVVVSLIL